MWEIQGILNEAQRIPGQQRWETQLEWEDVEVECPRFPPLPSDDLCSIEHWTRAMILDAK